ncbi:hypothetical protein BJX61DRAFT_223998 [Aspergillus egyptiacus]|nr:hypothetical protein BJX61DRAFT_223998 [Aspergillus egyptiacus]
MKHARNGPGFLCNLSVIGFLVTWLPSHVFGAIVRRGQGFDSDTTLVDSSISNVPAIHPSPANISNRFSTGDFPVCTDLKGPFVPFCLPEDGTEVLVDTTYYVTWNADFYPLNATITIELRYADSPEGSSAFTSEKTDNSYGYTPLHMRTEWLQGKPNNTLTLYIIELDSTLNQRASVRQGPTITLHPRPVEHYKPSPPARFNKLALYIGLPVSLAVVIVVVVTLILSMRKSREAMANMGWGSIRKGYGIGKSRSRRLGGDREERSSSDYPVASRKYPTDIETGLLEGTGSERYSRDANSVASYPFRRDVSRLKSWIV